MSDRLPASALYSIELQDLLTGIESFESGRVEHEFGDSTRFDLLVDGYRRLPPKAVVGLAGVRALGRVLSPADFSGGESSAAFRLLWDRGFEIVTKLTSVGSLDATFSVGEGPEGRSVLLESKGPERNVDYMRALESLLRGLADLGAVLGRVEVDSRVTRELPVEQRVVDLSPIELPCRLDSLDDIPAFRQHLTAAVAATGRDPQAAGGGNPTKRIRLYFETQDESSLFESLGFLAQEQAAPSAATRVFSFTPTAPPGTAHESQRRAIEETVVSHRHAAVQQALYNLLVDAHGEDRVSAECMTSSGRPADLILELPDGYVTYEIKTAWSAKDCVRQALGQLLEYTCWPGSGRLVQMVVVGPAVLDPLTSDFLDHLRTEFGLPIVYMQQSPD